MCRVLRGPTVGLRIFKDVLGEDLRLEDYEVGALKCFTTCWLSLSGSLCFDLSEYYVYVVCTQFR